MYVYSNWNLKHKTKINQARCILIFEDIVFNLIAQYQWNRKQNERFITKKKIFQLEKSISIY